MAKLKNPPPKRVRLTKNLGYETRKFLNYLDFRLMTATSMFDVQDFRRQCAGDLRALCANWNAWWAGEHRAPKAPRRRNTPQAHEEPRPCDLGKLEACPRCGEKAASFCHPTLDGGTYVRCDACDYVPQAETWAPDDRRAAARWNALERGVAHDA